MILRKINDSISVSPQIELEDAHELVRLGFKSIISDLLLGAGALGDRRHQAIESRLVSEGRSAATDLLAWHAQGPQMARLPGTEEDAA